MTFLGLTTLPWILDIFFLTVDDESGAVRICSYEVSYMPYRREKGKFELILGLLLPEVIYRQAISSAALEVDGSAARTGVEPDIHDVRFS